MSKICCTFAANFENCMNTAVVEYRPFTISVPKADVKRFKAIAKAMDWLVSSQEEKPFLMDPETGEYFNEETVNALVEAREDARNGRVYHADSAEEMFKQILS